MIYVHIGILLFFYLFTPSTWADIYKYIDGKGHIYFTDKPDKKGYKRLVKTWKGWVESQSVSDSKIDLKERRAKYTAIIENTAQRHRLPSDLLHAVIITESAYQNDAISRAGAVGLMQLMPNTAKRYGVKNSRDPADNIEGGSRYLKDLLKMFDNNLELALAAYNAGENTVKKYHYTIPPYRETQQYVKKVLKRYKQYRQNITHLYKIDHSSVTQPYAADVTVLI